MYDYSPAGASFSFFLGMLAGISSLLLIILVVSLIALIATIFIFRKASYVGWEALFPGYNLICKMEIAQLPTVAAWLVFLPIVHLIFSMYVNYRIAKAFGAPGVLCILAAIPFTNFIAVCILAFGKWQYEGLE